MNDVVPIILTKLQPPLLRRNTFPRDRLATLVRGCVERRLTLVCAGAGYGKTTLIASSLADAGLPLVWYSLSRSDRDLITFYSYLAGGLDRQWPGFAEVVSPSFAPGPIAQSQPAAFIAACVNRLAQTETGDFLVVLDDFQLVDHVPEICQTLDQLIAYAPPQAHFVVATRAAPDIPILPRLRAEGQVLEIGEADLKFTPDEVAGLFACCLCLDLPEDRAAVLVEQTEGWGLGLLMAGQSIKGQKHTAPPSPETRGSGSVSGRPEGGPGVRGEVDRRIFFDYLSEEVLRQQPPDVADFLVDSSILSRLEARESDAALGRSDSENHLKWLEQQCLFVARTGDGSLRYHRLFREFLLQHLARDLERLEALHRRAAAYFEAQGNPDGAIFHRLEAGDHREAARLIAALAADMIRAGRFEALTFWLGRLSEGEFAEFPQLSLHWGQMCESRGQWDQALEHYEQAAQAYSARGDLLGLSDVLRSKGHLLDWRKGDHVEAERLHREALSYVGEAHHRKRAALLASLARDQLSAGNTTAAQTLYREALAIYEAEADRAGQLESLLNPGSWLYHSLGDYLQALAVLRRAEQLALELNDSPQLAETYNNMAVNLYFLGRYAECLDCAGRALEISRALGDSHQEAFALMNQANGLEVTCGLSYADLYRQYQRALNAEQALGNQRFIIATLVFMMIFARRGGDPSEAIRRGHQALPLARERSLPWLAGFALIQLGAAQILIDPASARAALEEARQIFGDCGDLYHLMASHFWLAALFHSENNPAHLDHLRECLRLAVGRHYDYFFRAEAQAAIPLLVSALEHNLWPSYVAPILVKLGAPAAGSLRPLLSHADAAVRERVGAVLDDWSSSQGVNESDSQENATPRPPDYKTTRLLGHKTARPSVPPLIIHGFGNFAVWRGSHLIDEREWGRRKCKRLMKYLAFSPNHTLPKDAAIDLLWGDADSQAGNANFYRALYNLRRVIEPLAPHSGANYIALEGGLLRLTGEGVLETDVDEFVRGVEEGRRLARAGDPAASDRLTAAIRLYTDDFSIDDLYDDWARPKRDQLGDLYLSALFEAANFAANAGQVELAVNCLRQAFRKDNSSESACLNLMLALAGAGRRAEALQHFTACEKALAELDLSPSAELRAAQRELVAARDALPTLRA